MNEIKLKTKLNIEKLSSEYIKWVAYDTNRQRGEEEYILSVTKTLTMYLNTKKQTKCQQILWWKQITGT